MTPVRLAALAALTFAVTAATPAQSPKLPGFLAKATAVITPAQVAPGGRAVLTLTVAMAQGYHIYHTEPGDEFAVASELAPLNAAGVTYGKATWPAPHTFNNAKVHEGTIKITVPITVAARAKPGAVKVGATLKAQGCNESSCLPPDSVALATNLTIAKGK